MARCNKCKGCTTPECSVCSNCRSMKKFGGNGTIKKACLLVVLSQKPLHTKLLFQTIRFQLSHRNFLLRFLIFANSPD